MKHKHYEVIVAWAEGKEIQYRINPKGDWLSLPWTGYTTPCFNVEYEYRIKPETLKYRLALMNAKGTKDGFYVTSASLEAHAARIANYGSFVRWLTDWVEVEL